MLANHQNQTFVRNYLIAVISVVMMGVGVADLVNPGASLCLLKCKGNLLVRKSAFFTTDLNPTLNPYSETHPHNYELLRHGIFDRSKLHSRQRK